MVKDSSRQGFEAGVPTKYVEHARLDLPDRTITLSSRFAEVNGKVDEESHSGAPLNYFVLIDKKKHEADTIDAGLDDLSGCRDCKFIIRDMTDSFQIRPLVVQIVTPGDDDLYVNSFVGIHEGVFKKLFSIQDTGEEGVKLHRQGTKLTGHIAGRDEIVDHTEFDYPVSVDTKTFEVGNGLPSQQYIGFDTKALQSFRAHRVMGGRIDSSLVTVKAGSEVKVDTLYRSLGKVRLHVYDSVEVEIRVETAQKKLDHNHAG
jgi:hypothetical protein